MNFLIKLILSALSVIIASYLLPGAHIDGFLTAIIVAAILALFNVTIKPLLTILTIPVTVVTLGLFLLVINAIIVLLVDYFVSGFVIDGFWWALLFGIILAVVNGILEEISRKSE